jgi:4-amino-4-deoxy-L-arabinose transferase-like glycosyltransferase
VKASAGGKLVAWFAVGPIECIRDKLGGARGVERQNMKQRLWKAATSLALILVIALGARVAFAWNQERKMRADLVGLVPFLNETGNIAYSLAAGHGFSSPYWQETGPTAWLTPVYPVLVAGVFRVFGIHTPHSFFAIVFLNILFSTATCVPLFYLGKRVGGLGVASGAAWLWAIFPNAVIIPYEWVWDTSLAALLLATILWATIELAETQSARNWCGYGLLWGFALMTNPSLGSLLPVLLGWTAYRAWKQGNLQLSRPLLACGIAVLCCVPWTVRNYLAFQRFIPLRSNFPFELWLGNNEQFDEQSQVVPAADPERAEIRSYIHMGETAFMQDKWKKAIAFIRTHPKLEMILYERRFVATWTGLEKPIEGFRDAESPLVRLVLITNILAAIGGFCGIVLLSLRHDLYAFPLAAGPIVYPVIYYVTHTSLRYRHPIDAVMLLLAAIAVAAVVQKRRGHSEVASLPC